MTTRILLDECSPAKGGASPCWAGAADVQLQHVEKEYLVRAGGSSMSSSIAPLAIALLLLNGVTFAVFAYDKDCAIRGARRIPERTLFLLMSLGGSPGGWLAMVRLHHKHRKASFRTVAWLIVLLQIAVLAAVAHIAVQSDSPL